MTNQGQTYRELSRLIDDQGGVPCQDMPDIFFPEDCAHKHTRELAIKTARALCAECPLRLPCFSYAIEAQEPHGIWAGTLPHER
jgi:WhiB family redox-sensing transcriptional regulator